MRDCWLVGGDRRAFHWGAKRLQERERGSGAQPRTAGWCSPLRGLQASGRAGPLGITPPATRCPSPSAGSATAVSRASDPGKAQRAASSTPIRPPHTHREHRLRLTTVAGPTRLAPGRTHPGRGHRSSAAQRDPLRPVRPRPLTSKVRKAALWELVRPPDTPRPGHSLVPKAPPPRRV